MISVGTLRWLCAAVLAVVLSSHSASAATFTFLNNGADNLASLSFSDDGIDLVVSGSGASVSQAGNGLGVTGGTGQNRIGSGESLMFDFDPAVALLSSLIFERGSGTDTVELLDANNILLDTFLISGPGNSFQTLSNLNFSGSKFTIRNGGGGNGFRVAGITVSAVPLPAALPLFGGGLALMGLIGWRRKRAVA